MNRKLDTLFEKVTRGAKVNLAFGFFAQKSRRCDLPVLLCNLKQHFDGTVKTCGDQKGLVKIKNVLSNTDVMEACTKERANGNWNFYKLTNVTVFAALLKEVPTGCKDAVLPGPHTKNHTVNCLAYEKITRKQYNDNLCLF